MAKAKQPAAKAATLKADPEFVCVADRINFDDGRVLLRDQKIVLSEADAANYLKAETLARV